MKTTLNGQDYDLVIIDGNIVAQSLHHDLIFENGANEVEKRAEDCWKLNGYQWEESDFISDYVRDNIKDYCKEKLNSALKVTYNLN